MLGSLPAETVLGALLEALEGAGLGCTVVVDRGGRLERVYANEAMANIYGLDRAELLALPPPMQSLPPEERARLSRVREGLPHDRAGTLNLETSIVRPDGVRVPVEASVAYVPLGGGRASIAFMRDMTERLGLQAELMKQDQLATVGMLAAGVAHELNNPLMTLALQARKLRSNADLLGLPHDARQALEQMDEAARRMQAIIGDLLFIARPSEQPQAHVDVRQTLASTVALLRAGMAGCPPVHTRLDGLPPVMGYASKLGQVFLNVLRNAVQAVEGIPGGEIHVSGRADDDAVEITISDNGVGIPDDVIGRVTQPFFTTKPDGAGLGLWICQALVTQHDGKLEVKSVAGRGTTVSVRLPLRPAPGR